MSLTINDLKYDQGYFICKPSVVLRKTQTGSGKLNHLLLGDWLKYLGETHVHQWKTKKGVSKSATYAKVRSRGNNGWLRIDEFDSERVLEVNFIDVGQGDGCHIVTPDDNVIIIDAGISDNMHRFLCWRYNLRSRNVKGVEGFDPRREKKDPLEIDYVVMSHPDEDHYGGFKPVFENQKLTFGRVYHNGIVERPKETEISGVKYEDDLGGTFDAHGETYLYDYVTSSSALKRLVKRFPKTTKRLISAFRALDQNTSPVTVTTLGVNLASLNKEKYLPSFEKDKSLSLQILGPITERKKFKGKFRVTVRTFGKEDKTKNGHSIIFKARYRNLTLFLGGDLNSEAQNFLLKSYAGTDYTPDELEKDIGKLRAKRQPLKPTEQQVLDGLIKKYTVLEEAGRKIFEVDVAKACHHGSHHVLDSFIRCVNASATVISSGDTESHSHPRPDALGAYGKYGRGRRPLIFSTELARSTREFTPKIENYLALKCITLQIEAETDKKKKKQLIASLESKKDRHVAVYGMITLRALGDQAIIAQKLEVPKSKSQKWDIYELHYDKHSRHFIYDGH